MEDSHNHERLLNQSINQCTDRRIRTSSSESVPSVSLPPLLMLTYAILMILECPARDPDTFPDALLLTFPRGFVEGRAAFLTRPGATLVLLLAPVPP